MNIAFNTMTHVTNNCLYVGCMLSFLTSNFG